MIDLAHMPIPFWWRPPGRKGSSAVQVYIFTCDFHSSIGAPKTSHETIWFNVVKNDIGRCVDCGQAFKLVDPIPINMADYLPKTPLPSSDAELKALLDSLGIDSSHVGKKSPSK